MASNPRFNTQKTGTVRVIKPPSMASFGRGSGSNTVTEFSSGNKGAIQRTTLPGGNQAPTTTQTAATVTPVKIAPSTKIVAPELSPIARDNNLSPGSSPFMPTNLASIEQTKQAALQDRRSVLMPATEEQSKALRANGFQRFFRDVKNEFSPSFFFRNRDINEDVRTGRPGQAIGSALGTAAGIASISIGFGRGVPAAAKGVAAADRAFTATKVGTFLQATKTGAFIKGAVGAEIIAETLPRGAAKARELFRGNDINTIAKRADLNSIRAAGLTAQREQAAKEGAFIGIGKFGTTTGALKQQLPLGSTLFSSSTAQSEFIRAARQEAASQGIKGAEQDIIVREAITERNIRNAGGLGAFIGIGALAEQTGRSTVKNLLQARKVIPAKRIGRELAGIGFKGTFGAGVIEGAASVRADQVAESRRFNAKEIVIGAGLGGLTAGSISAIIGGTKITAPTVSKVTSGIANVLDPTEKPSDIVADIVQAGSRQAGFNPAVPTIQFPANIEVFTVGTSPTGRSTAQANRPKNIAVPPDTNPSVNLEALIQPITNVPTSTKPSKGNINPFVPDINVPVNPDPIIPVPTIPEVPTFVETPVKPPTNPIIPVVPSVPINPIVNVPVFTPTNPVIPPPIPLDLPLFGGGAGSRKGKQRTFINELAASQALFSRSVGFRSDPIKIKNIGKPIMKTSKKKKKSKNKSKRTSIKPEFPVFRFKNPVGVFI